MEETPQQHSTYNGYNQGRYPASNSSGQTGAPKRRKEGLRSALSTLAILILAPIVAILLTSFVFQSYEVDGPSMESTLEDQNRLIVWKVPRTIARATNDAYIPKRGDIIVFNQEQEANFGSSGERQLIKRVVALPGERIVVRSNAVTVYNRERPDGFNPDVTGTYAEEALPTSGTVDLVVPEGHVFVLGDNRPNSLDSRLFGPISSDQIVGELVLRVFPFNQMRVF